MIGALKIKISNKKLKIYFRIYGTVQFDSVIKNNDLYDLGQSQSYLESILNQLI